MRLKNIFNRKQDTYLIFLVLSILGLLIWSVWPSPRSQTTAKITQINHILDQSPSCNLLSVLLQSTYDLTYSEKIGYKESGWLILAIVPRENLTMEVDAQCRIVIETFLDIGDLNLNPGSRILEPFTGNKKQVIRYQYIMDQKPKPRNGNLWVYALLFQADGDDLIRLPLFAFPISIRQKGIFGVSPITLRIISIFLLVILFVISLVMIKKAK